MRDADTLVEEINSLDQECAPDSGVSLSDLRSRWEAVRDEIRGASDDEIEGDLRALLKNRLAETGVEILGRMHLEKELQQAQMFPADLLDLAQNESLKEEIRGAELDPENFTRLCVARRLIYKDRSARADIKKVIKDTREVGLQNAAKAALDLPRPVNSSPILFTFNSLGFSLFGKRDPIGDTIIKTHCLTALFLPLLPLSAYRVQQEGDTYYFISKNKLSRFARIYRLGLLSLIACLIAWGLVSSYLNSPDRLASAALKDTQALVKAGKTEEAIEAYKDLMADIGMAGGAKNMQEAATALTALYLASVPEPLDPLETEPAFAALSNFTRIPRAMRSGDASRLMTEAVTKWSQALDGPSVQERVASLRMLERAVPFAGPRLDEIQALRLERQLKLAAAIGVERPVDGVELYLEAGEPGRAPAQALLRGMNLSQLHSIPRLRQLAIDSHPPDPELAARITEATESFGSEQHLALLENPEEVVLQKAISEGSESQDLRVALADIRISQGRSDEAMALLEAIGKPGDMIYGAQLGLAQAYADSGLLDKSDALLTSYLSLRLGRFQRASTDLNARVQTIQDDLYAKANSGRLPADVNQRLDATSDESEQLQIFQEWLYQQMDADPKVIELRNLYDEYSDVVSAVLLQGMVKLQRANLVAGKERDDILGEAERTFLAIESDAAGLPSYHLNLGKVYHRLGKSEEGDAELQELTERGEPELSLAVARTYRELGLDTKAAAIAEQIWQQKQAPSETEAAELMALLAQDLDDQELWLKRADQGKGAVQIRLTEIQASRAMLAGNDSEADKLFGKVANYYATNAASSSASLNNAALANQSRYTATGDPKHLDAALKGLELALSTLPDNAIVALNLSNLRTHQGGLELVRKLLKLDLVRPTSTEVWELLELLKGSALHDSLMAQLRTNASVRRARVLAKQLQMLAPNGTDGWSSEIFWAEFLGDEAAILALAPRLQAITFDASRSEESRQKYARGEMDQDLLDQAEQAIVRVDRQLALARTAKHGPSIAALAIKQSSNYARKAYLEYDPSLSEQAIALMRLAGSSWSELDVEASLSSLLFAHALLVATQGDEEQQSFVKREGRVHGYSVYMMHGPAYDAVKSDLLPRLLAQPAFKEALVHARSSAANKPRLSHFLLGRLAGDTQLMELATPVFANEMEAAIVALQAHMDPLSKHQARKLALYEENRP